MAVNERTTRELAPFLDLEEKLLYAGPCYTGYSLLFMLAVAFALVGGLVYLALARAGIVRPVLSWRLALTDRRLLLCPVNWIGRLKKPGGEKSYRYSELPRAEMGSWLVMGYTWRLWTSGGERIEVQLPRRRHNRQALEEALRQAAPHLVGS